MVRAAVVPVDAQPKEQFIVKLQYRGNAGLNKRFLPETPTLITISQPPKQVSFTGHESQPSLKRNGTRLQAACQTCRQRRRRCDGTQPTCSTCTKAGQECLGYARSEANPVSEPLQQQQLPPQTSPSILVPRPETTFSASISHSQASLALTIVKTKPEGVSVEEFLKLLRRNARGERVAPVVGEPRYIDSAEFWKDAYSKLRDEKKALERKIRQLEDKQSIYAAQQSYGRQISGRHRGLSYDDGNLRNHQTLQEETDEHDQGDIDLDEEPTYRGQIDNLRKRHAPWLDDLDGKGEDIDPMTAIDKDYLALNAHILEMINQRTAVDLTAQENPSTRTVEDILERVVQLLDFLIETVLPSYCDLPKITKSQDSEAATLLRLSFHQVKLSFCSCFRALDSLCQNIAGRNRREQLIERLVKFFSVAFKYLGIASHTQAKDGLQRDDSEPQRKRVKASTQQNQQGIISGMARPGVGDGTEKVDEECILPQGLSMLISSTILALDFKQGQTGHSDVLEGILYHVFDRTGDILHEIIFKPSVAPSDPPTDSEITNLSTKLEARQMMQILHAALGGNNSYRKKLIYHILGDKSPPLYDLFLKGTKRIQATLVKSIVGDRGGKNFREAFKAPELQEEILPLIKTPQIKDYSDEWVVNTIWSLIGWDMVLNDKHFGKDGSFHE